MVLLNAECPLDVEEIEWFSYAPGPNLYFGISLDKLSGVATNAIG
jgi:hypothetical protein